MSHLIRRVSGRRPDSPVTTWRVLDPPPLTLRELVGDLRTLWDKEFAGASLVQKLAYSVLRIIQQKGYRHGYGPGQVAAHVPPPVAPDFSLMDRNLADLPSESKLAWLHSFLGAVNAGPDEDALPPPRSVILELANTCNLNCIGCGIGRDGVDASRFMDPSDLRAWAREVCRCASVIRINGLGEATLHPRLGDCLELLEEQPGGREIITNGSAPLEVYDQLLSAGFQVLVSWDGHTRRTFEGIRRGADYSELTRKMPLIVECASKRSAPNPALLFTVRPQNVDELPGTVALAGSFGISRVIANVFKFPDGRDWTSRRRDRIRGAFLRAKDEAERTSVRLHLPDHLGDERLPSDETHGCSSGACGFPWSEVTVRWNGDVTPCNMMNPYCYGNLRGRPFAGSWRGPEARAFRARANAAGRHPNCVHCYYVDTRRQATTCPSIAG